MWLKWLPLMPGLTGPLAGSKTALTVILWALLTAATTSAAKNPLSTIVAASCDAKGAGVRAEPCSEGGNSLAVSHDGDYALYRGYDFDSGVAAFKARMATLNQGSIEIRLDSLTGPVMGTCRFARTKSWEDWEDVTCKVNSSEAGVRDVYLIFKGDGAPELVKLASFVFLKTVVSGTQVSLGSPSRVDSNDGEVQATKAWGMPESGFRDDFEDLKLQNWVTVGMTLSRQAINGAGSVASAGIGLSYAFTPNVYINQTDTGGEWRTLAEAALSADIVIDSLAARPGIGFCSKDAKQWICVTLNAQSNSIEAWRKLADGSVERIKEYGNGAQTSDSTWGLKAGLKYRLQVDWSPYSDALIAFLYDASGKALCNFRTVIDLPAARRPLLVCSDGKARFDDVNFDPTLDGWNCRWEWKKTPVLTPDVCNPAVWKWKDGNYYMMWRKFGRDTYHGIACSTDGVNWTRVKDEVLKCTGDMNVVMDPFGDGCVYITPGGANLPWWRSSGSNRFTVWTRTSMKLGDIFGNSRIQEIIDTRQYAQLRPIQFEGTDYRFIGFTENWTDSPQPHTVILLSNTLTNWVLANPDPVIAPGTNFWGEKGNAIGSAFVLPDGNILVASCSCTFAGYTGAPEPSNVSAIVDGRQPWRVLKLGVLPDVPVSRENVWYEGPNFGTAYFYEPGNDTLFYYGGFHDYHIGVARVQNFSHSKIFGGKMMRMVSSGDRIGKNE
jgi:hypothetical protein